MSNNNKDLDDSLEAAPRALVKIVTGGPQLVLQGPRPIGMCPVTSYLQHLGAGSQRTQRQALSCLAGTDPEYLAWERLRYGQTSQIKAALVASYAPATARRMLSALRGVLRECWRLGLMSADDRARAVDLGKVNGDRLPAGRALTRPELVALASACRADPTPRGARDLALIVVLYGAGIRRAEAAALTIADYEPAGGTLVVRRGKGDKDRVDHVPAGGIAAVAEWIARRGRAAGALFPPVLRGGHVVLRHVTAQAVYQWVCGRADQAGIAHPTPHDFRRTFASDMFDTGTDVASIQALMGHSDPRTTARYDRRLERSRAAAVDRLNMDWVGKPPPCEAGAPTSEEEDPHA